MQVPPFLKINSRKQIIADTILYKECKNCFWRYGLKREDSEDSKFFL